MSEADPDMGQAEAEALTLKTLARDHAGLLIASGVAVGALVAIALTPSSTRRKLTERTRAAATAAGEAGMKLGRQGAERLEGLGEMISENADVAKERAAQAASQARSSGLEVLRAGLALIAALRR